MPMGTPYGMSDVVINEIINHMYSLAFLEWSGSKSKSKFGFSMLKTPNCKILEQSG